jgi:hypothetical protein
MKEQGLLKAEAVHEMDTWKLRATARRRGTRFLFKAKAMNRMRWTLGARRRGM